MLQTQNMRGKKIRQIPYGLKFHQKYNYHTCQFPRIQQPWGHRNGSCINVESELFIGDDVAYSVDQ